MSGLEIKADKMAPIIIKKLTLTLKKASQQITREARQLSPKDTGNLRDSWVTNSEGLTSIIKNEAYYSAYQEFGTKYQVGRQMIYWRSGLTGQVLAKEMEKLL